MYATNYGQGIATNNGGLCKPYTLTYAPTACRAANLAAALPDYRLYDANNLATATSFACVGVAIALKCHDAILDLYDAVYDYMVGRSAKHSYTAHDILILGCAADDDIVTAVAQQRKHAKATYKESKTLAYGYNLLDIIQKLMHRP